MSSAFLGLQMQFLRAQSDEDSYVLTLTIFPSSELGIMTHPLA